MTDNVLVLVEIDWIDSSGVGGWSDADYIEKQEPSVCLAIGYIVRETDKFVTIVQSLDLTDGTYYHSLTIPKFAITKMKIIKRKR